MSRVPRLVEVRQQVLKANDVQARALRERFRRSGTYVVSLVSSPGSGKTSLLLELLKGLGSQNRAAALVGDLATENDANRLAESGAAVRQIVTGAVCHLEAAMVDAALADWKLDEIDLLFIENVGNLVCPSSYDLGEDLRLVLVSTTEGEDKPLKYPTIFNTADVTVITKLDLSEATGFCRATLVESIQRVRPGMQVFDTSARSGAGIAELMGSLAGRMEDRRRQAARTASVGGA